MYDHKNKVEQNEHLCGADELFKVRYVDDLVIDMDGFIFPID
jgi:hypothetical protein